MRIYLDHAATTYLDPRVLEQMMPYFTDKFGNPSSQHSFGQEAMHAVDRSRKQIAEALGAKDNEIYFTSGGTESDNWAVKGIAYAHRAKGNHIITSLIEHPAVLNSCKYLERAGYEVTYLSVDSEGVISLDELKKAIKDTTVLISIMAINNEIGSIQPIAGIGEIAKEHKIIFHTDAVQAIGTAVIDVKAMNIDALSLSAHKFYGPKGIGALYLRNGVRIDRYQSGGGQERNMRAGTYNTASIVGMAAAMEIAVRDRETNNANISAVRNHFVERVLNEIPYVRFNGPKLNRAPGNANFSFEFIEGESLLLNLDLDGIATSSGSACSSGSLEPSHVLLATGLDHATAQGTIRFSFGKDNTIEEADYTVEALKKIVTRLRVLSPLFNEDKGVPVYV
ncbi:MAG: cysteine desulfurase NifS [Christensenellales bacterium]|jgi:cysteine desulfurase